MTLLELLHRASQVAERTFDVRMRGLSLTARQFSILTVAGKAEGLSQTAIVRATGIDRSTVTELVRRLMQRGLLQRRRAKRDARTYEVRLTTAGKAVLADAEPAAREADALICARVRTVPQLREALIELIEADGDCVPRNERVVITRARRETLT